MRGNTRRSPGIAVPACAPRGLPRGFTPVDPHQERALPLVGSPALERIASNTSDRRVRPFGFRAQRALPSGTSARKREERPFPPYPCMQSRAVPA